VKYFTPLRASAVQRRVTQPPITRLTTTPLPYGTYWSKLKTETVYYNEG